ncbi:MAG TPA: carbohydrate-binding family 9-like protein [Patescibacteria group bacterium]|nr:carbohydrate-binding family 9-like protein [Patescibacteria group bacterium]
MILSIPKVRDFKISGQGIATQWRKANWQDLKKVGSGRLSYKTKAKVVYSVKGIYFLIVCEDKKISAHMTKDLDHIYKEDVVELFLWPDEEKLLYLEYEVSPLEVELPLLIANHNGSFMGWAPWEYKNERVIQKKTSVTGGEKRSGAAISSWTVEIFIPFALLKGLGNIPAKKGTIWRANINRFDYDRTPRTKWAWCPDVGGAFHDYKNFGTFRFE